MKRIVIIILILVPIISFGQGVKFKIENLSKPKTTLPLKSCDDIYQNLIQSDDGISKWYLERNGIEYECNILAKSSTADSLVNFEFNSFFNGMYSAYADHRPFVLSPDMIWLLISQGFARHVNANPEKLRKYFVDFSGKTTLKIISEKDLLSENIDWEDIIPNFTSQIAEHTGDELIEILTSNFSTTTSVEKIASEITVMEAMKPYFEYVVMYVVCGIPEITLQGTPEDWQLILDKTKKLGKYDLKWWTKKLEPILEEFVNASNGKIKKRFWRNMFKYHTQRKYGAPKVIDGWIVKFFPYDKDGNRNDLKRLHGGRNLPKEIVKVDLKYIKKDGSNQEETMLELWAGFIGLEQNKETFALTPKIGWMIKNKKADEVYSLQNIESLNIPNSFLFEPGINLIIDEVPEILQKFDEIFSLGLNFRNEVYIPEWMKNKKIGKLYIKGEISILEKEKILNWLPNTEITINRDAYNIDKTDWITVIEDEIPNHILNLKDIWILEIFHHNNNKFVIPDELGNINIKYISFVNKISNENIEKLKRLLPKTNIYINKIKIQ